MKIALAGNPNCGKTTLFNAITGKTEHVANWSGVTVEKKIAKLKKKYAQEGIEVKIVDLPGALSISPYTEDEAITRDFILEESPDVIINIVDGSNIGRSLFFTTQLLELGIPTIIALNKSDVITKRGDKIDLEALSRELHCKIIPTVATSGEGLSILIKEAVNLGLEKKPHIAPDFEGRDSENSDLARQKFVQGIIDKCIIKKKDRSELTLSDKIDRVVAHKWLGLPIFFTVMWAVYSFSIEGLGGYLSDYLNEVVFGEIVPNAVDGFFKGLGIHPVLKDLIVEGVIAGVGAVIGFLPLIMVLFFCLSLLEDCGYMARVAVVMDRFFKKLGLSGKSIIPMIVGSGCSIPGVMATRTIEDTNQKRMTIILTPFVPCGAKIPIIALFAAVFFPDKPWVAPSIYIIAIIMIIIGALLLKKIFRWENSSPFIIELPEYKLPSLKYAFNQMLDKAKSFIYRATTIILVCNTLVWFAQAYGWNFRPVEDQSISILASIGEVISPILIPLGFVGWQMAAATITGFVAKENVVATFAVLLSASEKALHLPGGPLAQYFTPVTAFAYIVFNLFIPPCFAAIAAMRTEMGSEKWLLRGLAFQFSMGYVLALIISQIGTLIVYGKPAVGFVPAVIILGIAAAYLTYVFRKTDSGNMRSKTFEIGAENQ